MPQGTEVGALLLRIQTIGEKEAKAALDAIDASGKQAAAGLTTTERASSRLSESVLGTTGEMKKLGRELTASAGEALGFGKAAGSLGAELGELGGIGIGVAAAIAGLVLVYKELNRVEEETKQRVEATSAALLKRKDAAEAATVAGARMALQEAKANLASTPEGPGAFAGFKTGALGAIFGPTAAGQEAAQEAIISGRIRANAVKAVSEAEEELAKALQNEADGTAKADAENVKALVTLVKLGDATGVYRQQALLMLAGLKQSMDALPIGDTIGRAGLAGQINQLNEVLFPKLHEHVKKLGKELSALATAPHISITPSNKNAMASAESGGVVATESIFGKMGNIKESPATKAAVEGIHQQTEEVAKAIIEQQQEIERVASEAAATFGNALEDGFIAAFNGEGIGGAIKAFGKTILAGLGNIIEQQGEALLAYGLAQEGLALGLSNPFTAGPAAIAAGAALIALGAAFGAIAHGGGHNSSRTHISSNSTQELTRLKFVNRDGSPAVSPRQNNTFNVFGPNDPQAQRAIKQALENGARR